LPCVSRGCAFTPTKESVRRLVVAQEQRVPSRAHIILWKRCSELERVCGALHRGTSQPRLSVNSPQWIFGRQSYRPRPLFRLLTSHQVTKDRTKGLAVRANSVAICESLGSSDERRPHSGNTVSMKCDRTELKTRPSYETESNRRGDGELWGPGLSC
jgi:hypothetical protein